MASTPALDEKSDRPTEGRSWENVASGAGFDTGSPDSWEWEKADLPKPYR
jgi:hypothetical protein